jgi:hypothetical protein
VVESGGADVTTGGVVDVGATVDDGTAGGTVDVEVVGGTVRSGVSVRHASIETTNSSSSLPNGASTSTRHVCGSQ